MCVLKIVHCTSPRQGPQEKPAMDEAHAAGRGGACSKPPQPLQAWSGKQAACTKGPPGRQNFK